MAVFLREFLDRFLSPNTKFELWLRTNYHKLNSTRLAFQLRDWHSRTSCKSCFRRENDESLTLPDTIGQPKVSFVFSINSAIQSDCERTIDSIKHLAGRNWEIICLGDNGKSNDWLRNSEELHSQVKFISTSEGDLLECLSGDYIVFCEPGDRFARALLIRFYEALSSSEPSDVYYYNCECSFSGKDKQRWFFKPSGISPSLLLSVNYLSRAIFHRSMLKASDFQYNSHETLISQEYRLFLKLLENNATSFKHLPYVLISQKKLATSEDEESKKVIVEFLERQGLKGVRVIDEPFGARFVWSGNNPSVAIVIPTLNNRKLLEPLVSSILQSEYGNLSITIVDNNSTDSSTIKYLQEISNSPKVSIVSYNKKFNYSEAINLGAMNSESDLLLFLNDDMGVINKGWISELAQWAVRPEIGVVGTKLIRANHTIQHAGIILGLNQLAGHIYLNAPEDYDGLIGRVDWYRNYLAITGACQMVRRELFEEVGGYDEDYILAFSDIDFCLKIHEKGYSNIYTPFASLYHYEGVSRGYSTPPNDILQGYKRIDAYLRGGDPFFSEGLSYQTIPYCYAISQEKYFESINRRKKRYQA